MSAGLDIKEKKIKQTLLMPDQTGVLFTLLLVTKYLTIIVGHPIGIRTL
jgi:hypothetical protein